MYCYTGPSKWSISAISENFDCVSYGKPLTINPFEYLYILGELAAKSKELAAEIEAHKVTKEQLEKARKDVKKKSVLSLEMEDYERSMKELTLKMEESKKKMVQVHNDSFTLMKLCTHTCILWVKNVFTFSDGIYNRYSRRYNKRNEDQN